MNRCGRGMRLFIYSESELWLDIRLTCGLHKWALRASHPSWGQCKISRTKLVDIPANLASLEFLLRYYSHLIFQARLHCTEEHRALYETTSTKITRAQRLTTCGKTLVAIEVNPGNCVGTSYLVIYESICGRPDGKGRRVMDRSSNFQILVELFVVTESD